MGGFMLLHALPLRAAALWLCTSGALFSAVAVDVVQTTKPGCASTSSCGNLTFSYPFGMSDGGNDCHFKTKSNSFLIFCDTSTGAPTPYWGMRSTNVIIDNISVENHNLSIRTSMAKDCYDSSGNILQNSDSSLAFAEFPVSSANIKLIAVGCDTYATFSGGRYQTGCFSKCQNFSDVIDGACSGIGCCEISIPRDAYQYEISVTSYNNHTGVWKFNPCGYAFFAEDGFFNFSTNDLRKAPDDEFPLFLDWFIPGPTCEVAKKNRLIYLCQENSKCTDAENRKGYKCNCKEGYEGNAYLQSGCQGIFSSLFIRPTLDSNMFNDHYVNKGEHVQRIQLH